MAEKVTMAKIAAKAGISQAAVSMALRNHPRISRACRERIQQLAAELGYVPNPLVSSLMASRRSRSNSPSACIAYVDGFPDTRHLRLQHNTRDMIAGLKRRAGELGFSVERFSVADPAMRERGLDRVLKARGIRGVVLGNAPKLPFRLLLDWDSYALVAVSQYFHEVPVERVTSDAWQMTELAMRELHRRGYRRIGLAVPASNNTIAGRRFSGAYLDAVLSLDPRPRELLPPYLPEEFTEKGFLAWTRKHRPDAVVYFGVNVPQYLQAGGWRIPDEVGTVLLACPKTVPRIAGVNQNAHEVGVTLAERVAQMLFINAFGVPKVPRCIYVEGFWQEGRTVRGAIESG